MSEAETPAPEQTTVDPNAPAPPALELDVTQPVEPQGAPPLPDDPSVPASEPVSEPAPVEPEPVPAPVADTGVLNELLVELRDLKAKIVAAIGG